MSERSVAQSTHDLRGRKKGSTKLQELVYQLIQIWYSPWPHQDKQGKNRTVKLRTRIRKVVNTYTSYMHTCHFYKRLWHFESTLPWFFKETISQKLQKVLPSHSPFFNRTFNSCKSYRTVSEHRSWTKIHTCRLNIHICTHRRPTCPF